MSNCPFDSNQYAQDLQASGVPAAEARAFVSLKMEIYGLSLRVEDLSRDMDQRFVELRTDMDQRFKLQDERTDRKLAAIKSELVQWMFGFFVVQLGATFAMIKMLAHP